MKRWLLGGVLVAGAAATFVLLQGADRLALADPDCDPGVPVMSINLYGDLRQDDIAVVDREGEVHRLTKDDASLSADFSPDGRKIVFTSGREGPHEECCGFLDQEIYIMDSDGSNQHRLMPDGDHFDGDPAWSPDGDEIAFWRRGRGIMIVPAEGGEPKLLYEEKKLDLDGVSWAPDGEHLVFNDPRGIHLLDREAGTEEILIKGFDRPSEVAWSPDGKTLAFSESYEVYTTALEDPNPRLFVDDAHTPEWSPDGNYLAYYHTAHGENPKLMAIPADGGDEIPLAVKRRDLYSFVADLEWLDCP